LRPDGDDVLREPRDDRREREAHGHAAVARQALLHHAPQRRPGERLLLHPRQPPRRTRLPGRDLTRGWSFAKGRRAVGYAGRPPVYVGGPLSVATASCL